MAAAERSRLWLARGWLFVALAGAFYLAFYSFSKGPVAGCGPGSGCDRVPPAAGPIGSASRSVCRRSRSMARSCARRGSSATTKSRLGGVAGGFPPSPYPGWCRAAALWFASLQHFVLGSWCKFCLATQLQRGARHAFPPFGLASPESSRRGAWRAAGGSSGLARGLGSELGGCLCRARPARGEAAALRADPLCGRAKFAIPEARPVWRALCGGSRPAAAPGSIHRAALCGQLGRLHLRALPPHASLAESGRGPFLAGRSRSWSCRCRWMPTAIR